MTFKRHKQWCHFAPDITREFWTAGIRAAVEWRRKMRKAGCAQWQLDAHAKLDLELRTSVRQSMGVYSSPARRRHVRT